jgi:hypothetical protein
MFALVLLLLVALAVVAIQLANRPVEPLAETPSPSPSPQQTQVTGRPTPPNEPAGTATGVTSASATSGQTPALLPPAPTGPGERYVTGSHEMSRDDSLDLDRK